jgi:hypothetical protein
VLLAPNESAVAPPAPLLARRPRAPSRAAGAHGWNAFGIDNPATDALRRGAEARRFRRFRARRLAQIPDSLMQDALAFRSNHSPLPKPCSTPTAPAQSPRYARDEAGLDALASALTRLHREVEAAHSQLLLVCIPAVRSTRRAGGRRIWA